MESQKYLGTEFVISAVKEGECYRGRFACAKCNGIVVDVDLAKDESSALVDARLGAQAHAEHHEARKK